MITGHELDFLFETIFDIYNKSDFLKLGSDSEKDYKFIKEDFLPQRMISFLSEFATESRYRNLNILLGSDNGKYESPELTFNQILKQIQDLKFKHLSNEKYNIFDLCVREIFNSIVKMTRFLSNYFTYGGYGSSGMEHIKQAWDFLKYSGEPKLDLKKYER